MTKKRGPVIAPGTLNRLLESDTRGVPALLDDLAGKTDPNHKPDNVLAQIMGLAPPNSSPPEDMPAIDKIKLYARAGYDRYHIGTDEDFERVWAEAFPETSKDV